MIFLCYYNLKFFASEPFFIEEIEEFREVKFGYEKIQKTILLGIDHSKQNEIFLNQNSK